MTVNITISGDNAADVRSQMAELLGARVVPATIGVAGPQTGTADNTTSQGAPADKPLTAAQKKAAAKAAADTEAAKGNISSGVEHRNDPETTKTDKADETAESAGAKTALTLDDVRGALGKYVTAFGMDAAMEDGPKVLSLMFGEGKVKVSDVPDTQEAIAKAIAGIEEMQEKNPFKRTPAKAAA